MFELLENRDFHGLLFYIALRAAIVFLCYMLVVVACLIDFWSGRETAKCIGEPIESKGFRRTVVKAGDYFRIMMFALMIDLLGSLFSFYVLPFGTLLATVAVLLIEGTSVRENSKRKKAHAADVPEVVKQIVQCASTKKGLELFNSIANEMSKINDRKNSDSCPKKP